MWPMTCLPWGVKTVNWILAGTGLPVTDVVVTR